MPITGDLDGSEHANQAYVELRDELEGRLDALDRAMERLEQRLQHEARGLQDQGDRTVHRLARYRAELEARVAELERLVR